MVSQDGTIAAGASSMVGPRTESPGPAPLLPDPARLDPLVSSRAARFEIFTVRHLVHLLRGTPHAVTPSK